MSLSRPPGRYLLLECWQLWDVWRVLVLSWPWTRLGYPQLQFKGIGTKWHCLKLNCIHLYRSVRKHSAKHSASDYRTIQLQFDRRWLSSVRRGRWPLREIILHVMQAPISQSVLPGISTKTSPDIPNLTLNKLYIGYNWLVGPLRICISPMALEINVAKGETVCFFSHSHKYSLRLSDAFSKLGHHWLR